MSDQPDSTRDRIVQSFQQLMADRRARASHTLTKEEMAAREQEQEIVSAAAGFTNEDIVKGLADLQLRLGRATEELSGMLLAEMSRLDQVRRAIEIETRRLDELAHIETVAKAIDILVHEEQGKAETWDAQAIQQRALFEQEVAAQRAAWQKEQEENQRSMAEYDESLHKERDLAEADYVYNLERKQKIEMDEYETKRRKKEQELAEAGAERQRQWAERERAVAEWQQELARFRAQVAAFPQQFEEAVQQARERAVQVASDEAQIEADLFAREIAANQRVRELKIETLKATIARQAAQTQSLAADLKEAIQQAQNLASKAINRVAADEALPTG